MRGRLSTLVYYLKPGAPLLIMILASTPRPFTSRYIDTDREIKRSHFTSSHIKPSNNAYRKFYIVSERVQDTVEVH